MFNPLKNTYNYFKYGKVVHKGHNGNIIRKKVNYINLSKNNTGSVNTTKTFFNKDGKVTDQIERNSYITDKSLTTTVIKDSFDVNTGVQTNLPRRSKNYSANKDGKRIVDYTKNEYDYAYQKLPDGKTQYTIYYPDVTVIDKLNKTVTTSTEHKTYIK